VPASTAGLLLATEPVWVLLIASVLGSERPGRPAWVGSAVALAGCCGTGPSRPAAAPG
jgi:drug/metabolite transporter (DMT)-like permease